MKSILKIKVPQILLFTLFFILFEVLTFSFVKMDGIPKYFLTDILIVIFFASLIFLFKSNKVSVIYLSILMLFNTILFCTNSIIYNIFGDIFSISYLTVLSEAEKVFEWSYLEPKIMCTGIFVLILYITLSILLVKYMIKEKYEKETAYIVTGYFTYILSIFIIGILFGINMKIADSNTYVNDRLVNNNAYVKTLSKKAFKHYGMLGLYYKELTIKVKKQTHNDISDRMDYSSLSTYEGLLKNKNVITIMGETMQDFAICESLTPNLYKLKYEGVNFTNNYSVNKTNMSEMIGITGSYYSFYDAEYNVDFSIPNMLDNYKTTYIHDNNTSFYGRGRLVNYFGFDCSYFHYDLYPDGYTSDVYPTGIHGWENDTWHWAGDYTLDSETVKNALPYLVDLDNPFYTFYTSLVMHGPYDGGYYSNNSLYNKLGYKAKVLEAMENNTWTNPLEGVKDYEDYLVYYECAVMDFDKAIGILLYYLEENNLLDDTLLVIYGDHEAYYHDIYLKMANTEDKTQVDKLYQTSLIMYNKTLNEKYYNENHTHDFNTFTSPLVICPTILDLLGVTFNKNDYANYSIFDQRLIKSFYSTQQRAFMDNNFYTEDLEVIKYASNPNIDSSAFIEDSILLFERLSSIELIYDKCIIEDN